MTEEQAREKWCPMVRIHFAVNRTDSDCNCIGSRCMAWRTKTPMLGNAGSLPIDVVGEVFGHCGLAGPL